MVQKNSKKNVFRNYLLSIMIDLNYVTLNVRTFMEKHRLNIGEQQNKWTNYLKIEGVSKSNKIFKKFTHLALYNACKNTV